ncbi:MAG: Wzt carbohydrate-binding domain-containing protein [Oscillospiraceae bacterium]
MDGDVRLVTAKYMEFSVNMHENSLLDNKFTNRFGTHMGSIKNVKLSAENFKINDEISVFVELDVPKGINLTHAGVSVSVKNRSGLDLFVVATSDMNIKFNRTGFACINIKFLNIFNADEYAIAVGFEKRDEIPIKYYDYIEDACIFRSISDHEMFGLVHINAKIEVMQ